MTDPSEKNRRWLLPPPQKSDSSSDGDLKPGLYIVATPIGNLRDITIRALDVLSAVDLILCEDTRVTGKLLNHYGFKRPLRSYTDHSTDTARQKIVEMVGGGQAVALVSDAGLPLISDPGYKLVRDMYTADLYVTVLPGASASLSALQLSAQPSDAFSFIGFLPTKTEARHEALRHWSRVQTSVIIFERASRLLDTLKAIDNTLPDRTVSIAREITKLYEEVRTGTVLSIIEHYDNNGLPKGEVVLVLSPPGPKVWDDVTLKDLLSSALRTMHTKDAAKYVAEQTGEPRQKLYNLALSVGPQNGKTE